MRYRVSCGIIPAYIDQRGDIQFLLVQGHGDYWGFPKGHKEKGESDRETAERELLEETQVVCKKVFDQRKFTERYRIPKRRGTDIIKKVIYFVGITDSKKVKRQTTELKRHGWFSLDDAQDKLLDNRKKILQRAFDQLKNQG
ncbi:MAG: NUDIX domain-containing protein [Candidatus Pacebacteria bacterium]|nr:NUDIX domain-containing protein [Candidatus Paceibacterota bacterium]